MKYTYKLVTLLMVFLFFVSKTYAVDFYWKSTGRADQNYTNSANWESAPGSGIPANGSLAPQSTDDVYFPSGNTTQTIQIGTSGAAANFNVLSAGVITFTNGSVSVYGNFTSNGKHLFASGLGMSFLGTGNHTIDMGDNAAHGTVTFGFAGIGTYTLLSDLDLPGSVIGISNTTFVANGFWIKVGSFSISPTITGSKVVNLANSKLSVNRGAANSGALVFNASPATTSYDWTNAEIYINQSTNSTFINTGNSTANGTVINGIKSVTFTETTPGITSEHIRNNSNFTFGVTDFNINVSAFNTSGNGLTLNISNLNLQKPVDIASTGALKLNVNAINEVASCLGQSSLRSEGATPIAFNATSAITTTNIGFKSIAFSGSTVTMPANNDLGLNTGTYTTTTSATSRNFYWVGGTGNWNDPTKWSILGSGGAAQSASGCLPTFNDNVYFDAASFTAAGQVVTIGGSGANSNQGYAKNVYWTDASLRGRLTGGALNINGSADLSGSTSISSGLVYVGGGNHTVKSGNTVYTSGALQFFGTGIYTLTDDLIIPSALFQISAGTFNSNGKNITANRFASSSLPFVATNLRHIDFSNSVLTFTHGITNGWSAFVLSTPFLSSFNATGSTVNITAVDGQFYVNGYVNNGTVTLSNLAFNDINFTASTGTNLFSQSGVLNFSANNVSFASNASIIHNGSLVNSHIVNTYNLSPGKSYTFQAGRTFTVANVINSNSTSSCSPKVTIVGSTTARTNLYKAGLPFTIQNAIVRDINASGATLTVPGGDDLGNNLNVDITPNPPQSFYWVGGTGNWNDASHWSIGVSGGNPAVTNVNNCIPSITDDVFFDGNSFTAVNQTVTIDNNANCRNMTWENSVSTQTPIFAGASGFTLNTYGAVRLAPNMTFPFAGNWNMRGVSLANNANAITTSGVVVGSILTLNGGGRYDFLDNFTSGRNIRFPLGQFYANGHNITATSLILQVLGTNVADISNSIITLNGVDNTTTYGATHSANLANWNATGSTINVNVRGISISTPAGVTIDYGTMNVNQSIIATLGSGNGTLRFTNLNFLRPTSSMSGRFIVDNLRYTNSSDNSIGSGSIITVNNQLIANGTPCNPIRFRATTPGTPATFISTLCNFDLRFARLTDITAGGSCTASQNKVVGDDAGGNSNWTFSTVSGFEYLGADRVLKCNEYPYTLSTASFNQDATAYQWFNGATPIAGATNATYDAPAPGTYSVTVTYGTGCNLTDAITLGVTPNPVLNATTLNTCAIASGGNTGNFILTDANALLVATPANYTFSYHATAVDAIANINPLANIYTGVGKTVYVRVVETTTGCFSTRDVALMVLQKLNPTAAPSQKFCATVHTSLANIAITGTDIKWYADASSTTALPSTTLLTNGTTYFATQTVAGGCESDRVAVTVTLENCAIANPALRSRAGK